MYWGGRENNFRLERMNNKVVGERSCVQFWCGRKNTVKHYLKTLQNAAVSGREREKNKTKHDISLTQAMYLFATENKCAF